MRAFLVLGITVRALFFSTMACLTGALPLYGQAATGSAIYEKHCVSCHGANGEGVEEESVDPMEGDRSLASLT